MNISWVLPLVENSLKSVQVCKIADLGLVLEGSMENFWSLIK